MNSHNLILFLQRNTKLILAFLITSLCSLAVYLYTLYVPLYQSNVKLFIKNISNGNIVAPYGNEESLASESGYSNPLFNYQEIIRSELVAQNCYLPIYAHYKKELRKLGITNREQWIASFGKLIDTKVIPSTDIIQVAIRWSDKNDAADVAKLMMEALRTSNLEILRGVTFQQREFLDSQLSNISQELLEVRTQIKDFKLNNKAIDLHDETSELVRRRVELQQQLSSLHSNISYNQQKAKELINILGVKDAKDAVLSNSVGNDPYLQNLNGQLAEIQKEYQGMSAKFTDDYPPLLQLKNKMTAITQNMASHQKEVLGDYVVSKGIYNKASSDIVTDLARVQADAISLKAQYSALQEGIASLKGEESSIPVKKLALDELEKKELALANAYDSVKKKQMEAHIQENAIVDNIIILSEPSPGHLDIKQLFLVVFGFLSLGLMSGIAVAWIKEGIRDEWLNSEEVEQKTGKPVLGSLAWQSKRLPAQSAALYPSQKDLQRTFDNIAHNLVNRSALGDKKIISFCSLSPQRQASPVISQLALSLVNAGHKVLLIDADMQFPLRHLNYFDYNTLASSGLDTLIPELNRRLKEGTSVEQPAFNDIISESISHIQVHTPSDDMAKLDYISSVFKQERAYDFLASPGFKTLIRYSKEKYDFVLIDTPALPLNFPEMDAVTSLSEGIVLLSPYATKKAALIRQIKRLEAAGKGNLGILIRNRQTA